MAVFARLNGKTEVYSAAGRQIALTKFAKTNMTQTELDAVVQYIELTNSVLAIGADTVGGFVSGSTDLVHIITEGPEIVDTPETDFGGVTGVTATAVCYFA
jgi:hypothetical protein